MHYKSDSYTKKRKRRETVQDIFLTHIFGSREKGEKGTLAASGLTDTLGKGKRLRLSQNLGFRREKKMSVTTRCMTL